MCILNHRTRKGGLCMPYICMKKFVQQFYRRKHLNSVIFSKVCLKFIWKRHDSPPPSSQKHSHRSLGPPRTNTDTITCSSPHCTTPRPPAAQGSPEKSGLLRPQHPGLDGSAGHSFRSLFRDVCFCC